MSVTKVPEQWWKRACQIVNHPLACVSSDHRFVWTNSAFERLVGRSSEELSDMTWMEITVQDDVGSDLASIQAVLDGESESYTIGKHYKHKHGREVPVILSVHRFPSGGGDLLAFIVEAAPVDTQEAIHALETEYRRLAKSVEALESSKILWQRSLDAAQKWGPFVGSILAAIFAFLGWLISLFVS